jgi:anti-anti-sigma factor
MDTLDITEAVQDGTAHLQLTGTVDLTNAHAVSIRVQTHLAAGANRVVVDLSAVPFMDSHGLRHLVLTRHYADLIAKTVRVIGARGLVADLIELAGLTEFLAGARAV